MLFSKKRELLEYLGKNPKDNKLVDRLILRGEVRVVEGMYEIVDKDEEIKELRARVAELEKQEGKNTWLSDDNLIKEELYEARIQWEYYEKKYNEEVEDKQNRIRRCFRWIKQIKPTADWDEFRDWVMKDDGEL